MLLRILFFLCFLIPGILHAQIWGIDYLLGHDYQNVVVRSHPKGAAAGFFAGYYRKSNGKLDPVKDALPTVEALAKTGKAPIIRIHFLWSDSHSYGDGDIPLIIELAKKYNSLAKKYPHIQFELSPFCEHNLRNPDKYLDIVKKHAPCCTVVNTVWKGAFSKKYKNEVHNTHSAPREGPYNFSWDGVSSVDANVTASKKKHSRAQVYYSWMWQNNKKLGEKDTTPRPLRKVKPTVGQLRSQFYQLKTTEGKTNLPNNWLWKSHGDQHQYPPERRASKPVLLSPVYAKEAVLVGKNNKVFARLPHSGKYHDGRHLYRLDAYGFKISKKLKRRTGSPAATLKLNGRAYGKVNPAFRKGSYR